MSPPRDGGPAFPVPDVTHPNGQIQWGANGMSLRAWLAGQALSGMLANPGTDLDPDELEQLMIEGPLAIADAMIAALNK